MVKLPDASDLGYVGPSRVTPNISMPNNPIPEALAGFGQKLTQTGEVFGAIDKKRRDEQLIQQNLVDVGKAEADWATSQLQGEQAFKYDNDYATMPKRAAEYTDKERNRIAAGIRDPMMRTKWQANTLERSARFKGWAADHAGALEHTDNQNGTFKTIDSLLRTYRDPASTPEMKAAVLKETEAIGDLAYKTGLIDSNGRDAIDKAIEGGKLTRAMLETKNGQNVVGGGEFTPKDIPPQGAAFLNVVSAKEAGGYNVMNGGQTFNTNGPHPNRVGAGGTSTAAGKYQFIYSTWQRAIKALGLPDQMTPENQDKAAWWNAQFVYKDKTGRDLAADLQDPSNLWRVRRVLGGPDKKHGEWTGLQDYTDNQFATAISGGKITFTHPNDLANAPDYVKDLAPEDQQKLVDLWESEQNKRSARDKTDVEIARQNAPTAIQNTGTYTGDMPTLEQFNTAYGPQKGAQEYAEFNKSMEVASAIYGYGTHSNADIVADLQASVPTSSGTDAALETAAYEKKAAAAQEVFKAREADPAAYVMQHFPDNKAKWDAVPNAATPEDRQAATQAALTSTAETEKRLGIQNMELLPKSVAHGAATSIRDESLSFPDRINPAMELMAGTNDPTQRKSIFDQMVREGMPDKLEGAFRAQERGDTAAAQRLFMAGMTDQSKLPKSEAKDDEILTQWQTDFISENQIGDIFYGFNGAPDNTVTYERDRQLVLSAVKIEMAIHGKDLQSAVASVGKDMFGDVHVVNTGDIQILASSKPEAPKDAFYIENLKTLMPKWEAAFIANRLQIVEPGLPTAGDPTSARAITNAVAQNMADQVFASGFATNYGNNGFIYINTLEGSIPIPGPDGNPLVFSKADFARPNVAYIDILGMGRMVVDTPSDQTTAPATTPAPPPDNSPGAIETAKRMRGSKYGQDLGIRG